MRGLSFVEEGLQGWGRHRTAWSLSSYPETVEEVADLVTREGPGRVARGKGRSYGDASLNAGHLSIRTDRMDHAISFDAETGDLVCEAGLPLRAILRAFVPRGWFLPVTPGTGHPSIGGGVACDVHGKNHHVAGSISRHVRWIELVTAEGKVVRCGPDNDPDLFAATVGGMGLTGVIVRLCIRLKRISTAWVIEESSRVEGLDEMMERLTVSDETHPYTVSWMDCAIGGSRLGRGHVILGRHAEEGDLEADKRAHPLRVAPLKPLPVPVTPPFSLVNNATVRIFNNLRIQMAPRGWKRRPVPFWPFFYPLDVADDWNRLYGPRGFVQYQFVVPFEAGEAAVREAIVRSHRHHQLPSLVVLKRFGEAGVGHLSFPEPGWTLAMDLPIVDGLWRLLDELDRVVLGHGGRVYLVKDARLSPETFRRMYPRFEEWLRVKQRIDPEWRFTSNMARRLKLEEGV